MNCGAHASCSKNENRFPLLNLPRVPAMYSSFRQFCERLLRIPHDPTPPPGDEASTRIFRAAPAYYKSLLFLWGIKTGMVLLALTISVIVPAAVSSFLLTRQGNKWGFLLCL